MVKITLVGASWCPITKETRKLWEGLKEEYDFDYEYVDIETEEGEEMIKRFSITSVPKTIVKDRIVFHGLPEREEAIEVVK